MKKVYFCYFFVLLFICFLHAQNQSTLADSNKDSEKDTVSLKDALPGGNTETVQSTTQSTDSIVSEDTLTKNKTSTLKISTDPDSTIVVLDGEKKGKTPITLENIPVGKHILNLKKAGYFLKIDTIDITSDSIKELQYILVKPATLIISSEPAEAIVMINNEKMGITPYKNNKLRPETYLITLIKNGYQKKNQSVTLASGQTDSISIVLSSIDNIKNEKNGMEEKKIKGKEKSDKTKLSAIFDKVALGIFAGFSLIILIIELTQNNK